MFAGRAAGAAIQVGALTLPARAAATFTPGQPVNLFIRPEHVRLAALTDDIPPGAIAAIIQETTFFGSLTRLHLALPDGGKLWADLPSEQAETFRTGSHVAAQWDATAPRVMAK